ncbi:conjugal transfer protein TraF [Piscirickettsia litoralis]|uniref:Conjugal transfer protein TraF n=1 Tax=Piscirickettsia litoralis TaxID=1891921 RepID=A0ABX3A145_9GAMM|nr:conjugal transfer protein TraF [Piscirickettsia litoralis]ODN41348.1 hypothetical protein BGC07_16385 [Piscirickettsia litoralis]
MFYSLKKSCGITLLSSFCLLTFLSLQSSKAENSFYSQQEQGWFWYKSEPKEVKPKRKQHPKTVNNTSLKQPTPTIKTKSSSEAPLSSAWLRKNLPKYLDAAQDNPTLDNVKTYFYLQRIAMDKANRFSDMAQLAVVGNPNLDELSRRPTATFASQEIDKETKKRREHILNLLKKQVGIFFFFRSTCPYCEAESKIIKVMQNEGFKVIPISTDGKPFPNGSFPNYKIDTGQSKNLGIQQVPALFLVSGKGEVAPLGQGLMSYDQITQRMLISARQKNWISQSEFDLTRPLLHMSNNLANKLQGQSVGLKKDESKSSFIPPEELLHYIENHLKERG